MTEVVLLVPIQTAIQSQRTLRVSYPPGERLIEPHCLGQSSDGNLLLRAFQISGASASGEHENWKLFRLDRFSSIGDGGGTFDGPRPLYNPADPAMKGGIIACL